MSAADESRVQRLLALADHHVPGLEATAALWARREENLERFGRAVSYELVVDPHSAGAWQRLLDRELPKIGRYFEAKRVGALGETSVLIAVWADDVVHLFAAPQFFAALAAIEDTSLDEIAAYVRGEKGTRPFLPLVLGPGDEPS
ncbi:MAG: hypothetical protein IT384_07320 [Deltaproteobacteria bacterium]|nr:hypothetical protein [Deltaproteobacteria bacterium]